MLFSGCGSGTEYEYCIKNDSNIALAGSFGGKPFEIDAGSSSAVEKGSMENSILVIENIEFEVSKFELKNRSAIVIDADMFSTYTYAVEDIDAPVRKKVSSRMLTLENIMRKPAAVKSSVKTDNAVTWSTASMTAGNNRFSVTKKGGMTFVSKGYLGDYYYCMWRSNGSSDGKNTLMFKIPDNASQNTVFTENDLSNREFSCVYVNGSGVNYRLDPLEKFTLKMLSWNTINKTFAAEFSGKLKCLRSEINQDDVIDVVDGAISGSFE